MAISRASDSSIQDGLPRFNNIWDGTTATSAFDSLGAVIVGSSGQASITFSNIPQTYTQLQIRGIARSTSTDAEMIMRFNSDSAANYARHNIGGYSNNGAAAATDFNASTSQTSMRCGMVATSASASNIFSSTVWDILDYTNTNKTKTLRWLSGQEFNGGTGYAGIYFGSGLWFKTPEAITSITITTLSGSNFDVNSSFSLYGVK